MDPGDAGLPQAMPQLRLGARPEDQGELKRGQTLQKLRREGGVHKEMAPDGFSPIPKCGQGQGGGQESPTLRMSHPGEAGSWIMAAESDQGRPRQQQVPQGSLVPDQDVLYRSRRRQGNCRHDG
jgi:hypothetical protein